MNKLIGALLLANALNVGAHAQLKAKPFELKGILTGATMDTAVLSYSDANGKYLNSKAVITNGHYDFKGLVEGPESASLTFKDKQATQAVDAKDEKLARIFIDPAIMQVTVDWNDMAHPKMSGSKTQKEYEQYEASVKTLNDEIKSVSKQVAVEKDTARKKELKKQQHAIGDQVTDQTFVFFEKNPDSYVSLYLLLMYGQMRSFDTLKKVYATLSPSLQQSRYGKMLGTQIEKVEATSAGKTVSDFTATDVNGKALSLADFKGKYLIIDFWASWCVPCRHSHPHLRAVYNKYKDKGLDIIGIADDDPRPAIWKKAIAQDSIGAWHHILSGGDQSKKMAAEKNPNDLLAKFGVTGLPTKLIVDPQGKIILRMVGDDAAAMDSTLQKIFNF